MLTDTKSDNQEDKGTGMTVDHLNGLGTTGMGGIKTL